MEKPPNKGMVQTSGALPVLGKRDSGPRIDGRELLLADVVVEAATVLANASAEHQRHGAGEPRALSL